MGFGTGFGLGVDRHEIHALRRTVMTDQPSLPITVVEEAANDVIGLAFFVHDVLAHGHRIFVDELGFDFREVLLRTHALDHDAANFGVLLITDLLDGDRLGFHHDELGHLVAVDDVEFHAVTEAEGRAIFAMQFGVVVHMNGLGAFANEAMGVIGPPPHRRTSQLVPDFQVLRVLFRELGTDFLGIPVVLNPVYIVLSPEIGEEPFAAPFEDLGFGVLGGIHPDELGDGPVFFLVDFGDGRFGLGSICRRAVIDDLDRLLIIHVEEFLFLGGEFGFHLTFLLGLGFT